jgi:hypothetical protein
VLSGGEAPSEEVAATTLLADGDWLPLLLPDAVTLAGAGHADALPLALPDADA